MKTYKELCTLPTYEERLKYLQTKNAVGVSKFGSHRFLNQRIYSSTEWRSIRNQVILRDNGCDLGLDDYEIFGRCYIHHIEPLTIDDILDRSNKVFDMDNLITVSFDTHQKIHYSAQTEAITPVERSPNDTAPWRK